MRQTTGWWDSIPSRGNNRCERKHEGAWSEKKAGVAAVEGSKEEVRKRLRKDGLRLSSERVRRGEGRDPATMFTGSLPRSNSPSSCYSEEEISLLVVGHTGCKV